MGNSVEIDFKLYLDNKEYVKVVRGDFWYILRRKEYEYFALGEYRLLVELWRFSTYVLNIVADKFAVVEKNRWGKEHFLMLSENIKFGNIICKLVRK